MTLVPQNINEAIKHLTPRSEEEILSGMHDLPLYQIFPFLNDKKIKLDRKEEQQLKSKLRKDAYRFNKIGNEEIENLNLSFNMGLPNIPDKDLIMLTSSTDTYFKPKEDIIVKYGPADTGILRSILTHIKLEFIYVIYPGGGLTIILNYDWHMLWGANGTRINLGFDENGEMINCPWKYTMKGKNRIYTHNT